MNKRIKGIIICEGETDRDLLGFYLDKKHGWKYCNSVKNMPFTGEKISWYENIDDEYIGIWIAEGSVFREKIEQILQLETMDHLVEKVIIITDNDDSQEVQSRFKSIKNAIQIHKNVDANELKRTCCNEWGKFYISNAFGKNVIELYYMLIPIDECGALETFMMNSLSENNEQKNIVMQSKEFIEKFESEVYLRHRRERVKAQFGVTVSIMCPDRSLYTMKELIESVDWSELDKVHKQFAVFEDLR